MLRRYDPWYAKANLWSEDVMTDDYIFALILLKHDQHAYVARMATQHQQQVPRSKAVAPAAATGAAGATECFW